MTANIYTSGDLLPRGLMEDNFFHSPRFFGICQRTPRHRPYMVTLESDDGQVAAQMMAVVRYRTSWFPPYYYMHCRIMGEGTYRAELLAGGLGLPSQQDTATARDGRAEAFGLMLQALTARLGRRMLYVEVSHLSHKMFGYRQLCDNRYFPVRWMSIHNSLHSRTPEERISQQMQHRIESTNQRGVVTEEVKTEADFREFMRLLRHHNWLKPKRYIPADEFFAQLWAQPDVGCLSVTRYRSHIVGCSAVVYSHGQAYLWYAAYRRKTYALLHPRELTIWHAIKDAHSRGYEHIFFMDVGLPFRKNKFRDFILRFGGKPVSTYRWFRFSIKWLNSLLSKIYHD